MFRLVFISCISVFFSISVFAAPVQINNADADSIASALKGIGPSKAAAIVKYREEFGPFESLEELKNVKGIGQKIIDSNREDIKLVLNQ